MSRPAYLEDLRDAAPVTFEYEGKEIKGELGFVPGTGNISFDLMVNSVPQKY